MTHTYKHNGFELSSVTTIISDCTDKSIPLTQWASNMVIQWIKKNCNHIELKEHYPYEITEEELNTARFNFREVSQKARDIGSEVHNAIKLYLKDKVCRVDTKEELGEMLSCKEAVLAFKAFLDWENENNLKPIKLEQIVYGNCWAGTLDFCGYFNDKLYVIDWKSSKAYYPEMRYQVAAYRWAVTEKNAGSIVGGNRPYPSQEAQGCGVLRLDKVTGMPSWHDTSKTFEKDLKVFNKMKELYFARHPRISKKAGYNG